MSNHAAQTAETNYKAMSASQQVQAIDRLMAAAWERAQTPRKREPLPESVKTQELREELLRMGWRPS